MWIYKPGVSYRPTGDCKINASGQFVDNVIIYVGIKYIQIN